MISQRLMPFLFMTFPAMLLAQGKPSLQGAWQHNSGGQTTVWIIADGYYMQGTSEAATGQFVKASGGILKVTGQSIEIEVEFNSARKEDVGNFHLFDFTLEGNQLTTQHHEEVLQWQRIDDGTPGILHGAWLFSGRRSDAGEAIQPYTPGVRKTMKILSGTRFQWAAYNTETREFMGTGGGTYTAKDGKYTETIRFFSRDNNRVNASLSFDMDLQNPHWLHSGLSSRGDPIFERWSRRTSFEGQ